MTKKTRKKTPKKVEEHVVKHPSLEGAIDVSFSKEELVNFANLLSICASTFENLASQAVKANDENAISIFSARQKLSSAYAYKLLSSYSLGEPESRDVH